MKYNFKGTGIKSIEFYGYLIQVFNVSNAMKFYVF